MIRSLEGFTIVCDGCGADANEGGDYAGWTDVGEVWALSACAEMGWVETGEGKHHCEECRKVGSGP